MKDNKSSPSLSSIMITGTSGIVGQHLVAQILESDQFTDIKEIILPLRGKTMLKSFPTSRFEKIHYYNIHQINEKTDWASIFSQHKIEIVIHLAAHVHSSGRSKKEQDLFYKVNALGTQKLAQMAQKAGVQHFIFISSSKAIKDYTDHPDSLTEKEFPTPHTAYGKSKHLAEEFLHKIVLDQESSQTNLANMKVTILRPPMIYGFPLSGNYKKLAFLVKLPNFIPFPFRKTQNKRSLLYIKNFSNALLTLLKQRHLASEFDIFHLQDGPALSIEELFLLMASMLGKKKILFPLPRWSLNILLLVPALRPIMHAIYCSLVLDDSKFKKTFKWTPIYTTQEAFKEILSKQKRE